MCVDENTRADPDSGESDGLPPRIRLWVLRASLPGGALLPVVGQSCSIAPDHQCWLLDCHGLFS
jgi:hypothetical protein